jgi:DNA polymerase-3 subunit epsilon
MFDNGIMENNSSVSDQVKNLNFVVFDLETTGGNHQSDKIIEIGLVKISELGLREEKSFLINPEIRIPDFIQKLTNIKERDVADAPLIEEVIDEVLKFMGDHILVAHNTSFDVPFFNSVLRRLDREELRNPSICTNLMTKYLIPNLLNSNLNYMSKLFDIHHKKAHRALDDAKATAELLIRYLKIFIHKDIQKINHLYYPRNRYELDRLHFKTNDSANCDSIIDRLHQLKTPALFTLKGENGVILFSLPSLGDQKEIDFIEKKIKELPWLTATIKLFGPFIEAFIHFNGLYSKMDHDTKIETIKFMWGLHFPKLNFPSSENEDEVTLNKNFAGLGDFIVTRHLVPEQLIILPIQALSLKNQLIFRYPSHKKKLLQYINSKSQRMINNKLRQNHFPYLMKIFLYQYLLDAKSKNDEMIFFKKKDPINKEDEFYKKLEKLLAQKSNGYQYPKDYI